MPFKIDAPVVCPAYGVGRMVGLVLVQYLEAEACLHCEIAIGKSTGWVPVETTNPLHELRPIAPEWVWKQL